MLKGITFYRLPCSRFVNRCITLSAFIACTWIGCWSVSGQTTTQEQQTDSKVVTASHSAPVKMFSQPTTAPWEVIGNEPGYVKIQVGRILNHPDLKPFQPMLTTMFDSAFRPQRDATSSIEQFGLTLDEITHIQGGVLVSFNHNPDAPDGHRSSINFGMSKAELTADNLVDWPGLINAFDYEKLRTYIAADSLLHGSDEFEKIREAWLKSAQKSRSYILKTDSLWKKQPNTASEKPTATKKAVWEAVSGGALTVIYDIRHSGEVPKDYEEEDPVNQANMKMTIATETAAWGVDLSQDNKTCQVRFAAAPKVGFTTDDLLKQFEAIREVCEQSTADDDFSEHLFQQLQNAKVTIVKSKTLNGEATKAYLLVEGECSADFSRVLNFKRFK